MAEFGWAFVKGNLLTSSAPPSGAVQFNDGNSKLAASDDLIFVSGSTSQLNLTGTLNVSGTINANQYNVNVTNQNVTNLTATGSTKFGNSADDIHQYTGSINVLGGISSSANVSASAFFGDGSNLSGITTTPAGANTQIQFNNSNNFGASSNLTFDGSQLSVLGQASASLGITASAFHGDGSNLTGIAKGADTQIQFNNSSVLDGSSNLTFDGSKVSVLGQVSASLGITASAFHGDGSNLTNLAGGSNNQIQFNNSGELGGSSGLTYNGSKLHVAGEISSSLAVSASAFHGDGSNLSGIATTLDQVTDNGNTTTNAMTASALNLTGLAAGTAANTNFLALDSSNNVVLTSSVGAGGGSTIGEAEDGTYADGLFSDFTTNTPIGTAIDKFNEILKIIVPGPAPAVDRINYTNTDGIETKLSFDLGDEPTGYTAVGTTGSFTTSVDTDDQYTVATSGEDFRLGVYDGTQEITGVVNYHVAQQLKSTEVNYSHDAFGNAESGSLKLILNGSTVHTLNLAASGAGNPNTGSASDLNSSGSGFFEISVTASAQDQNGSEYDIFQHRTAKYVIDPNDQRKGWNHAKIIHEYGSTTYQTNFVQWFNDTDAGSNAMTVTNPRVSFTGQGSKYLSGVQYFRSASLTYRADVNNAYRFTYPTGNVLTFNVGGNLSAIAASALGNADVIDLFDTVLSLTKSTSTTDNTMLDDSTTISLNLTHPLKTNLSSTGSVTTDEILIYNIDTANSNLNEYFDVEDFRITTGAYGTQNDVTASAATWNSQNHMTSSGASGHEDGLLYYNGRLYSPRQGANGGDFEALTNGPLNNPDYSTVNGTRNYFRKVQNTSGSPVRDLKITTSKQTRINSSTLTTNNAKFTIKIPGSTGWMDISKTFNYGQINDDHGALITDANDNSNTSTTSTGNGVHCITFGTESVAANDYVVVKIEADDSWTGFINTLQFQLGASDVSAPVQAPVLDDIDADNSGETNAKLSFGASNPIAGFENVEGDGFGAMDDFDSNERYSLSGDRRGVFSSKPTLTGKLNEDVGASGNNYAADSFRNAYTGSLVLEVNGTEVHEVSLTSSLNAITNDFNGNSSGFSVSAVSFSETSDSIPDYTKPYRTGTYQVGANDQNVGWNYARVIHRTATDQTTNYVEWVVDTSSSATSETNVSTPSISNFNHPTIYYQSGVRYFATNPSGTFSFTGSNFYNNVYQNGTAISFPTTTNCSVSNIRVTGSGVTTFNSAVSSCDMPALNNTDGCETTSIEVTGTLLYDGSTPSISGGLGLYTARNVTATGRILHPFKTDRTTNSASKSSFMIYSGSNGSTDLGSQEYFNTETYRIISGNYAAQSDVTASANAWNSQNSMNDGASYPAYNDGMVTANGYLISPLQIGNAGDTRNVAESGSLQAPAGSPNYSTSVLSESVRTYYRYFRNTGITTVQNFNIYVEGDASIVAKQGSVHYGALGANNRINIEMKVPGQTAWGDVAIPQGGVDPTSDGDGIFNGGNGNLDQDASNGSNVAITLGTLFWDSNDYIVLKISAHKDWTGYLTEITASY